MHRHKAVRVRSTTVGREVAVGRAAMPEMAHQRARWPSRRHLKQRVRLLQAAARWSGEKQLKHRPRRSAGTQRRGPHSASRRALRERLLSTCCQPLASGPRFGSDGWAAGRSRILGAALRGGLTGGPDEEPAGAAGIAARSTSLKDKGVAPSPDFPDGGVS